MPQTFLTDPMTFEKGGGSLIENFPNEAIFPKSIYKAACSFTRPSTPKMFLIRGSTVAALLCLVQGEKENIQFLDAINDLKEEMLKLKATYEGNLSKQNEKIAMLEDDLEDRVNKLEDLAKVGTLHSDTKFTNKNEARAVSILLKSP